MARYIHFCFEKIGNVVGQMVEEDGSPIRDEYVKDCLNKALTGRGGVIAISPHGVLEGSASPDKKHINLTIHPALLGNKINDVFTVPARLLVGYLFFDKESCKQIGRLFFPSNIVIAKTMPQQKGK